MKGKIFNAQEVQAIIAGNKTQFRKVVKNYFLKSCGYGYQICNHTWTGKRIGQSCCDCDKELISKCPYKVGQKIFCKESFSMSRGLEYHQCHDAWYWADGNPESGDWTKPKPAQHMKQEHSRLTLLIKEIRVERLTEISEEDAIAEGATSRPKCHGYGNKDYGWSMNWSKVGESSKYSLSGTGKITESDVCMGSAKYAFGNYWNATHKKPEEKFEESPFVWKIEFKVVRND